MKKESTQFVRVSGTSFKKGEKEMLFRGLGIGSWLNFEHFMVGIPTPDNQIRKTVKEIFGKEIADAFFDKVIRNFVTEKDFAFMKLCGINLLRVPFNYRLFIDDEHPETYKSEGFAYFDYLLDLCDRYEIYLMPDLHTTPGGQNPDWHSDNNTGVTQFWHYKVFRGQMVQLWAAIAEHCKNREYLLGYDLLNEPYLIDSPDLLTEFYRDVTEAVRRVDQNHILLLEGDHFAMQFDCIHEIYDENTALTFHYYPTVWEPRLLEPSYDPAARRQKFREVLDEVSSIRETFHRPILCGEAGCEIEPGQIEHVMTVLGEMIDLFNEKNISWTLWSYKDAHFMSIVYPKDSSPWMQLVARVHETWNHHKEMDEANDLMNTIRALPEFKNATDELCYFMQFRQRGILYRFQTECILKPLLKTYTAEELLKLPDSFLLDNCDHYESYAKLLREKTK